MESTRDLLPKSKYYVNNDSNNVNRIINNNVNNNVGKYSLAFTPNNEKAVLAQEIADYFDDLKNYAFHLSVVNKLGIGRARELFSLVKSNIQSKRKSSRPVRNTRRYYVWCYKNPRLIGL